MTNISEKDWMKLADYAKLFAAQIRKDLACDWYIDEEEIRSVILGCFAKLITEYRPGAMSCVSWCYQYGKLRARRILADEYRRIKSQEEYVEETADDFDDELPPPDVLKRMKSPVEPYKPLAEHVEERDELRSFRQKLGGNA